jgi:hypothetical protein
MEEMSERMKTHFGGGVPVWYRCTEASENHDLILSFLHGLTLGLMAYAWWKDGTQYVGTCGTKLKDAVAVVEVEIARIEAKRDDA